MQTILPFAFLVGLVAAQTPSNSYLPPPASRAYPQAQSPAPTIIAARASDQSSIGDGHHNQAAGDATSGFARNGLQSVGAHTNYGQEVQARFSSNEEQGYDQNAASYARNAIEEVNSESASYNFGYMVNDYLEGTDFGHHESRQAAKTQGEYHVVLPDGRKQTVIYEADERGFKPQISYEDSEDLARSSSGYDSNANSFRANTGYHGNEQDGARSSGYN